MCLTVLKSQRLQLQEKTAGKGPPQRLLVTRAVLLQYLLFKPKIFALLEMEPVFAQESPRAITSQQGQRFQPGKEVFPLSAFCCRR